MEEKTQEAQKGGWCTCCDGTDKNCRCLHHAFSGFHALRLFLIVVILGVVFAMGVSVGKFSSWHRYGDEWGYGRCGGNYGIMPMHQNGFMPMMQYPGWYQNGQWVPGVKQGATPSATSTAPSAQQ